MENTTSNNFSLSVPKNERNISNSERFISIASGSFILFNGLVNIFNRPKSSFFKVAAGGALLMRGAMGYCPLKDSVDSPSEPHEKITIIEHR